jgi:short-subunit dehydrogenase
MQRSIVITGASRGLGAAFARYYAKPHTKIGLIARNFEDLERVADQCRGQGADVECASIDVRDRTAMKEWLQNFDDQNPVDLLIVNAGLSAGTAGLDLADYASQADQVLNVNMMGVTNSFHPLLSRFAKRQKGHIVLISSLAGYAPWSGAPAYAASKAFVRMYGLALAGALRPKNIDVTVLCPGFIRTDMTKVNSFPMPFLLECDAAIVKMAKAIEAKKVIYSFPAVSAIFARFLSLLPDVMLSHFLQLFPHKSALSKDEKKII